MAAKAEKPSCRRRPKNPVMPAKAGIHDYLPFPRRNIWYLANSNAFSSPKSVLADTEWVILYQI
jgi:hypothetical protein